VDREETCVTDFYCGAVWKGEGDRGCGLCEVIQIMLHFEKVNGGPRVYNVFLWC
jgi:hypothetical protein